MADPAVAPQGVLDELVESGAETGLQLAVYRDGELVVDAWAGVTERGGATAVDGETAFTVYSVSKGVTAVVVHLLVERGVLAYDAPIARYWPEFGGHGKEGVTVAHALTHTAGLMCVPTGTEIEDQTDWAGMCDRMAGASPMWEPGSQFCYHALTYGWLLGGVAERADGRPFPRIVAEEIAGPLGLDGLWFGTPEEDLGRVATLEESPELLAGVPGAIPNISPPGFLADSTMNRAEIRRSCLPGHGMVTTARSLARVYASLIGDGVDGVRLLPRERVEEASRLRVEQIDASSGNLGRFALGWGVGGPESAAGPRETAFGHAGYGGSYGLADPEAGLAIGFTKNYLTTGEVGETSTFRVLGAVRETFGVGR